MHIGYESEDSFPLKHRKINPKPNLKQNKINNLEKPR